jgi:hypothetical protein
VCRVEDRSRPFGIFVTGGAIAVTRELAAGRRRRSWDSAAGAGSPEVHLTAHAAVDAARLPCTIHRGFHSANGGGSYSARANPTGAKVALKEGSPAPVTSA